MRTSGYRIVSLAVFLFWLSVQPQIALADASSAVEATTSIAPKADSGIDHRRPVKSATWHRAELYFGLGKTAADDAADYRQRWQTFLDEEVTPRFPDGFTVLDGYGQWQRRDNRQIEHLNSRVLVILYRGTAHRRDLDALRAAWKRRTGDESVLLSITRAEVSF